MIRLGGPLFSTPESPESWALAVRAAGYRAAFCPVGLDASDAEIHAYAQAAHTHDIVIAEVGAWSNTASADAAVAEAAITHCQHSLALADAIGARCCVNIAGSRNTACWHGPHPDDLSDAGFDGVVELVRRIIDAVKPVRSFYTLETMPWLFPDSTDSYLRLIAAVDRPQFAVHFDPVNLVSSPQRFFTNGAMIRDFIERLGPHIRSCHAKDIALREHLTVHLDEVRPGLGGLDYRTFLSGLTALDGDIPLMLEHLPDEAEYSAASDHIRSVGSAIGISL